MHSEHSHIIEIRTFAVVTVIAFQGSLFTCENAF